MIKLSLQTIFLSACFAACTGSPAPEAAKAASSQTAATEESACYAYTGNNDSVLVHLVSKGENITGTMMYSIYEKDRNDGTLAGVLKGDTLIADYTFSSEGTTSVRQVAFLLQNGALKEGFGDVEEKEGKTIFKRGATVDFSGFLLTKTACK